LYVSKVIFAPLAGLEMQVMQIFLLFFRNSFFLCSPTFWFRRFVFEWDYCWKMCSSILAFETSS